MPRARLGAITPNGRGAPGFKLSATHKTIQIKFTIPLPEITLFVQLATTTLRIYLSPFTEDSTMSSLLIRVVVARKHYLSFWKPLSEETLYNETIEPFITPKLIH